MYGIVLLKFGSLLKQKKINATIRIKTCYARFQVLRAVNMKITAFWDVTPCSLVEMYCHFGGTSCLHLWGR
jgi:hypothetical protein